MTGPQQADEVVLREVHDLVTACLLNEATATQRSRLEELVCQNDAARGIYLDYIRDTYHLHLRTRGSTERPLSPDGTPAELAAASPDPGMLAAPSANSVPSAFEGDMRIALRPTPLSLAIAALVMGLILTAMAFMASPFYRAITANKGNERSEPPRAVAQVTGMHDVVWASKRTGAHLIVGRALEWQSGLVEVTFNSKAKVIVEGPARLHSLDENDARIDRGSLFAVVPPSAVGFTVRTPVSLFNFFKLF